MSNQISNLELRIDTNIIQVVSNEFSRLLQLYLTPVQMTEVIQKNKTPEYNKLLCYT